jgi:hypothetical protein
VKEYVVRILMFDAYEKGLTEWLKLNAKQWNMTLSLLVRDPLVYRPPFA